MGHEKWMCTLASLGQTSLMRAAAASCCCRHHAVARILDGYQMLWWEELHLLVVALTLVEVEISPNGSGWFCNFLLL